MKAIRVNEWGKPVQLEDIPTPKPGDDEVLVRVHAASINPFDAAILAGYVAFMFKLPLTLGTDFSGEVVEVGKDVKHVKPGDEVYGSVPMHAGAFAEYAIAKAGEVTLKPKSLDHIQAAVAPLPALAAWQSLFEHGQFKDGERVLIHGVGGAVGGLAAQFAKSRGAYVYGTDVTEKAQHVAGLGIDKFIDTKCDRFEDIVKNPDIVLDYIGGEFTERSYSLLEAGNRYISSLTFDTPQDEPQKRGFRSMGFGAQSRADQLAHFADLFDAGNLKVFVNRAFPLEEAQSALDYRYISKAPGKVVLTVL